jgi:LuxR family transcriptional regulator, maltose regulon positive regulatory protein
VPRTRLLRRLQEVRDVAVVLILGPAGAGKTTLLSQWAERDGREFAWISVTDADNDPVRLLTHVASALDRLEGIDPSVFSALATRGISVPAVVVPRLARSLRARANPFVLALDDVHLLTNPAALTALLALADQLPAGSQLVLATRSRPEHRLGRLRAEGRCAEIGPAELALTAGEGMTLLREAGVRLGREDLQVLLDRTEGWAAGLYLAALSLREAADVSAAVAQFAGSDRYIVDYFRDELLGTLPHETLSFLLCTAVLRELCGELCDEVLDQTGSAQRLAGIERRNLFLVPLDRHGGWYRYHHLLAEVLGSELHRRAPATETTLHRRAAAWFERHGRPEDAVRHARAAGDSRWAARLVATHAHAYVDAAQVATVRRWVEGFSEEDVAAYPPLAVIAAWVWGLTGDPSRAERCVLAAERGSFTGRPPDGTASIESGVSIIRAAMGFGDVHEMLAHAQRVVDLEPPGSPWEPIGHMLLGCAQLLSGSPGPAAASLELAAEIAGSALPSTNGFCLAERSLLAADGGDWHGAGMFAERAVEVMHAARLTDYMPSLMTYAAQARVAAHQGDADGAREALGHATRLSAQSPAAFPWMAAQSAMAMARTLLDLEDPVAARLQVQHARRYLARRRLGGVLPGQLAELERFVATLLPSGSGWRTGPALSPAELRVLMLLPTHLTFREIGEELHITRNTVKTHVVAIYRKLQVTNRADAVRRARANDLTRGG